MIPVMVSLSMRQFTVTDVLARIAFTLTRNTQGYLNQRFHCHSVTARYIGKNYQKHPDFIVVLAGTDDTVTHSFVLDDTDGSIVSDTFTDGKFENGRHIGHTLKSGRVSVPHYVEALAAYRLGDIARLGKTSADIHTGVSRLQKVKVH